MNIVQTFKMAMKSIFGNKKRSFLTMLGIIIGVASVIALIGLASSATAQITEQFEGMGTNLISVYIQGRSGGNRTVTLKDVDKFAKDNADIVEAIIPSIGGNITVKYGNENVVSSLEGTNEKYQVAKNTKPIKGRFISALDVEQRQNVALIGTYIAKKLFPNEDPLNKQIKLNGEVYEVVGVIEQKSTNSANTPDDKIYIPYTSAVRLMKNNMLGSFSIQAKSPEATDAVMVKIEKYLFDIFQSNKAYYIMNQKDMLKELDTATAMLSAMLGGIASISLIVGGIGIMNIMLVSVTERTREIGVRKAIGASRGTILVQFLIEAVTLSGFGGIIGVGLGVTLVTVIGSMIKLKHASASIGTILLAFGFSVAIGVFFGLSPANKASKLRPIDALRSE